MFTKASQLRRGVRYNRRYQLCTFIHELKKLVGRKYHKTVKFTEKNHYINNLYIAYTIGDTEIDSMTEEITSLCDKYRIPRANIMDESEPFYTDEASIIIFLYTDF
jgi:hypothetical protein